MYADYENKVGLDQEIKSNPLNINLKPNNLSSNSLLFFYIFPRGFYDLSNVSTSFCADELKDQYENYLKKWWLYSSLMFVAVCCTSAVDGVRYI